MKTKKKKKKTEIRTLFEEEDYYQPKRVGNFWNNSYIEYESSG